MKLLFAATAAVALMTAAPALAADDDGAAFSAIVGADYSTGKYGTTEETEVFIAPVSLQAKFGQTRLTVTAPYLRIDGPANFVSGGDPGSVIIDPSGPTGRLVREGMGDVSLGVAYSLSNDLTGPYDIELAGRVKLPTADEDEGLGTGETDYTVSLDVARTVGAWTPFVTIGYRVMGDPAGLDLDNTLQTSIGTSLQLSERYVALFSYDYNQATTSQLDDGQEIFAALNGPLTDTVSWTVYGVAGLSDGSPDAEGGLALTFRFR